MNKCKHGIICDAGYGRKRCIRCDALVDNTEDEDDWEEERAK